MIELENITYNYKKSIILNQISFDLEEKDFCILFGGAGSGKTSLLHIIMGFNPKCQGSIKLFGSEINPRKRNTDSRLRFVPKNAALEVNMTIEDYLKIIGNVSDKYSKELREGLWQEFQLPTGKKMLNMSYQQNKLIQILAAVWAEPDVLILDEPGLYLQENIYDRVLHYLRIWTRRGKTVLIASREYPVVARYANCYVYLKYGQLVSAGPIKRPDYRQKVVTVNGGNPAYLDEMMDKCITKEKQTTVYLYKGDMKKLPEILNTSGCRDCTIEELTMEEELEEDYSGWE